MNIPEKSSSVGANIVYALVKRGAQLDIPDSDGLTPLLLAASHGLDEIVRILLELGAYPESICPKTGWTALQYTKNGNNSTGRAKVASLLAEKGIEPNPEPLPPILEETKSKDFEDVGKNARAALE